MKRRRQQHEEKSAAEQPPETHPRPKRRRHRMKRPFLLGLALLAAFILFASRTNSLSSWPPVLEHKVSPASRRFPKYGTPEFAQQCNWTLRPIPEHPDCTFFLRVYPGGNEGIAEWISEATSAYILARQSGCQVLMDYGESVEIHQVLTHLSLNWTIPKGFECLKSNQCYNMTPWTATHLSPGKGDVHVGKSVGKTIARVPYYRFAYINSPFLYPDIYDHLEEILPGFKLGSGMACSLGSLFDLSPTVSQFMPDLYTRILPTVRDERSLVMAVYIRTGKTDSAARAEKDGKVDQEHTYRYRELSVTCLDCAVKLEQRYLAARETSGVSFERIVWMLVTDSAYIKQWVGETYGSQLVNQTVSSSTKSKPIPREIVTTTSRGVQTRTARNPSTVDFAEAFIDWYLIGESDLVVSSDHQHTFGATASLRTARPFYHPGNCTELPRFGPPRYKSARELEKLREERRKEGAERRKAKQSAAARRLLSFP